jgi:hypothetical protein
MLSLSRAEDTEHGQGREGKQLLYRVQRARCREKRKKNLELMYWDGVSSSSRLLEQDPS